MKTSILLLFLVTPFFSNAMESKIAGDIAEVVTFDSGEDTEVVLNVGPYYRFRAIRYRPIKSETGQWLVVEKLYKGTVGVDYQTEFSKKIKFAANKVMEKELKTKNPEQAMFCCGVSDLKWDGFKLKYKVFIQSQYSCEIPNVNKGLKPNCKKIK